MKYLFTDFYRDFSCMGGKCPDTCCAGWEIAIDEKTYEVYASLPEPQKSDVCECIEEVSQGLEKKYRFIMQEDERCPFLNKDNLCDLYIQVSPDALCHVCKTFPRKIVNYYDVIWATVTAACPEVVRLLLDRREPIGFDYSEDLVQADTADADWMLYNELINGLVISIDILQDRQLPFWQRVHMVTNLTIMIDNYIKEGKLQFLREQVECVKTQEFRKQYIKVHGLQEAEMGNEWKTIYSLLKEIDNMASSLEEKGVPLQKYRSMEVLGEEGYRRWRECFLSVENEVELENLSVSFVFEYYMDALKGKPLLSNIVKMILLLLEIRIGEIVDFNTKKDWTQKDKILLISRICRCMENTPLLDILAKRVVDTFSCEVLLQLAYLLR